MTDCQTSSRMKHAVSSSGVAHSSAFSELE